MVCETVPVGFFGDCCDGTAPTPVQHSVQFTRSCSGSDTQTWSCFSYKVNSQQPCGFYPFPNSINENDPTTCVDIESDTAATDAWNAFISEMQTCSGAPSTVTIDGDGWAAALNSPWGEIGLRVDMECFPADFAGHPWFTTTCPGLSGQGWLDTSTQLVINAGRLATAQLFTCWNGPPQGTDQCEWYALASGSTHGLMSAFGITIPNIGDDLSDSGVTAATQTFRTSHPSSNPPISFGGVPLSWGSYIRDSVLTNGRPPWHPIGPGVVTCYDDSFALESLDVCKFVTKGTNYLDDQTIATAFAAASAIDTITPDADNTEQTYDFPSSMFSEVSDDDDYTIWIGFKPDPLFEADGGFPLVSLPSGDGFFTQRRVPSSVACAYLVGSPVYS